MKTIAISTLTVCGIEELPNHRRQTVTHVLSLLDPDWPEIEAFRDFGAHRRTVLQFHDTIAPVPGKTMPMPEDAARILAFGEELAAEREARDDGHLLVHCHMGVSRSTAAMLSLLAQMHPQEDEDVLFAKLRQIRPQAWPNSVMVGYADDLLSRGGRLTAALQRHYRVQIDRDPDFVDWMTRLGRQREVEMAA